MAPLRKLHALPSQERQAEPSSDAGPADALLVAAARAGEAWAMDQLFARHQNLFNGFAYRLLEQDQDIQDVVQDSFLQALRSLSDLKDPQAFSSWVCSIIVRRVHRLIRRRRLLRRLGLAEPVELTHEAAVAPDAPPDVIAELKAVFRCAAQLPSQQRTVLLLRRVESLSLPKIAELTGMSVSTVKRRLAAAESLLDAWLEDA